jgi:prepilin-type N-terminal cleavage/methylation domain-containing protein
MSRTKKDNNKGFTLIELLVVMSIIAILSTVAMTSYVGTTLKAARSEAYANLEALRLLEEQFYAENAAYTPSAANTAAVMALLTSYRPGNGANFTYSITQNVTFNGAALTPCFRATATGIAGTRVAGDVFNIDCNNNRNF